MNQYKHNTRLRAVIFLVASIGSFVDVIIWAFDMTTYRSLFLVLFPIPFFLLFFTLVCAFSKERYRAWTRFSIPYIFCVMLFVYLAPEYGNVFFRFDKPILSLVATAVFIITSMAILIYPSCDAHIK